MASAEGTDPVFTDRLLLTPASVADIGELKRLYGEPLIPTGPDLGHPPASAWARGMEALWTTDGVGKWMAHDRSDGTLVGRGGLSRTVVDDESVLEVGYASPGVV